MAKLWGGRFEGATHALVEALGESVSFDSRLAPWDIRASIAHANMLGAQGIITKRDAALIVKGLKSILADIAKGDFTWDTSLEDVHTNIEVALVKRIGDAGKRLHTARSRNDQIATDVRLWLRDQIDAIVAQTRALQRAFLDLAEANIDVIMPGYTHLQPAQQVLFAHHMQAYVEMFQRDAARFLGLRERVNVMPLGSAALAGTPHPIDREAVARALGFAAISANSMDAVADRDHLIEFCSAAAITMMHLSRFSEELIIWSNPRFAFVEIGDAFTTGSSIMPQKKNPDVAELVRGKTGRVYGDLNALLVLVKGLPLTYNRDLQEDKEPVFDASDTVQLALQVFTAMLPSISVRRKAMEDAAAEGFMEATDLADYLVTKGVPFREAHEIVGKIVLYCGHNNTRLPSLDLPTYQRFSKAFERDVFSVLSPLSIVNRRDLPGGTALPRVKQALRAARRRLAKS